MKTKKPDGWQEASNVRTRGRQTDFDVLMAADVHSGPQAITDRSSFVVNLTGNAARLSAGHLVQELIFPDEKSVPELYLRTLRGHVEVNESSVRIDRGAGISTNTYFNSFYEDYWYEYTDLEDAKIVLQFKGKLNVEIFRDRGINGCRKIKKKSVASRDIGVRSIYLPVFEVGKSGRVFMDIIAEEDSEIYYMGIRTDNPPAREPGLSFGICACNHEENLLESLRELVEYPEDEINIAKIIVVNQGSDFKLPGLKELIAENDLIRCISRENSAGCRGFARTIYESLNIDEADYHILMRDDVQIDRRILGNLSAFMAYLTSDVVIGGHTLDLLKPWFLYAEDARGHELTGGTPLPQNTDLRMIDSLRQFSSSGGDTRASWWFCAVPQKYLRLAGNFLPVSDRGDNLEFVTRLEKMGVITMGMPGIAVWRKP